MVVFDRKAKLINEALALTGRPDRTTDRTRKSIELAVLAACELTSPLVDSRHLLCGLVREGNGVARHILEGLGLKRELLEQILAGLPKTVDGSLPRFDDDLVVSLNRCWTFASALNHNYIGTEHLLLGIVRAQTRACELLQLLGIDGKALDTQIQKLLEVPGG